MSGLFSGLNGTTIGIPTYDPYQKAVAEARTNYLASIEGTKMYGEGTFAGKEMTA